MPATIFRGSTVQTLKDILSLNGNVYVISGDSDDPTSVAKDAPINSLYMRDGTSELYKKLDNGSTTNWELQVTAGVSNASVSAGLTASLNIDTYYCDTSGGAFTIDLPTAVGNSGKRFTFKYTDTGFANALTIDGNAAETIDGATTTTLNTQNETLVIESDGANWEILNRKIPSIINAWNPTMAGFGTITQGDNYWKRINGNEIHLFTIFASGTTVASTASASLPTGLTLDTTAIAGSTNGLVGMLGTNVTGRDVHSVLISPSLSTSNVYFGRWAGAALTALNTINGSQICASGDVVSFHARLPINGWNT